MFIALAQMPMGAILKLVTEWMGFGGEMPLIPEIDTFYFGAIETKGLH